MTCLAVYNISYTDQIIINSWLILMQYDFFRSLGAQEKLAAFISESGNMVCADCGTPDPKWV